MIKNQGLRVIIWFVGLFSVIGNLSVAIMTTYELIAVKNQNKQMQNASVGTMNKLLILSLSVNWCANRAVRRSFSFHFGMPHLLPAVRRFQANSQ